MVFVDNLHLQSNTYERCLQILKGQLNYYKFRIRYTSYKIYSYYSTQKIFVGFFIDSVQMTLEIKKGKKKKIHNLCLEILQKEKNSLRLPASVIGNFEFTIHPLQNLFLL